MKKIIIGFLASIGFLAVLLVVGIYFSIKTLIGTFEQKFEQKQENLTETTVLKLQVGSVPFVDVNVDGSIFSFLQNIRTNTLFDTVTAIKHAAQDPRIKGILLTIEGSTITLAEAQELREALTLFKKNQKKVYAFAYSFGESSSGTTPYYLATIADAIYMQPQGSVELTGYAIDSYFLKGLFDKYKIKPQLSRREGYKGIIETYTNNDFSPETRENLSNLLNNMLGQVQDTLNQQKGTQNGTDMKLFEDAPYLDTIAVDRKLITKLAHQQEVEELFHQELNKKPTFVTLKTYKKNIPPIKADHKFALISVEGEITTPVPGNTYNTSQNTPRQIAQQLRKAAENPTIKAVILRVNSPGGTVTGAEIIWHEVDYIANTLKKPIIVSMGTLAASAGYQIAAPATKIIANPGTITGSIGVATGKIALGEAAAELGIHLRQIRTAKYSGMWSTAEEFSPEEWHKLEASLDHYYNIFLQKVSNGRHLSLEATQKIAKGQVWTGQQAKEHGLVDELGGFLTAIDTAKQLCNISKDTNVEIVLTNDGSLASSLFLDIFENVHFLVDFTKDIKGLLAESPAFQAKINIYHPH